MDWQWIAVTVFGLFCGIISWVLKIGWDTQTKMKDEIQNQKSECRSCKLEMELMVTKKLDESFDRYLSKLDSRLDDWWSKIELQLINNNQILPRNKAKKPEDGKS